MAKVAFIGLGVMGYPMAGHLLNGGATRSRFTIETGPRQKLGQLSSGAKRHRPGSRGRWR